MTLRVEYGADVALLPNGARGVSIVRVLVAHTPSRIGWKCKSCIEIQMTAEDAMAMAEFSRRNWATFEIEDFGDPCKRMRFSTTSPSSEFGEMCWYPGENRAPI